MRSVTKSKLKAIPKFLHVETMISMDNFDHNVHTSIPSLVLHVLYGISEQSASETQSISVTLPPSVCGIQSCPLLSNIYPSIHIHIRAPVIHCMLLSAQPPLSSVHGGHCNKTQHQKIGIIIWFSNKVKELSVFKQGWTIFNSRIIQAFESTVEL